MTELQRWLIAWVDEGFRRKPWRNQAWLAEQVGISQKHLSQMLTGGCSRGPVVGSLPLWDALLVALEVRDDALG